MWDVDNNTPFPHQAGFMRDERDRSLWCVDLKAGFLLRAGRPCLLAPDQEPLRQEPRFDGSEMIEDGEITLPKSRCDIIVDAAAPQGVVTVQLGAWPKSVTVAPSLIWSRRQGLFRGGDDGAPVPLRWSRSARGANDPAGVQTDTSNDTAVAMPRLHPDLPATASDQARPCGFTAIPRDWPARQALAGTYD